MSSLRSYKAGYRVVDKDNGDAIELGTGCKFSRSAGTTALSCLISLVNDRDGHKAMASVNLALATDTILGGSLDTSKAIVIANLWLSRVILNLQVDERRQEQKEQAHTLSP